MQSGKSTGARSSEGRRTWQNFRLRVGQERIPQVSDFWAKIWGLQMILEKGGGKNTSMGEIIT